MEVTLYKKVGKVHGKLLVPMIWGPQEHLNGLKLVVLLEKVEIIMIRKLSSQFQKKAKLDNKEINQVLSVNDARKRK